jgi:predicted dithiol-disulfide oxidoreductase (DUF899 family)
MEHRIATKEEWLAARKQLLIKEKELTHLRDRLSAERRALPWIKVEKTYLFDAPEGKVSLSDLFDGRSQLYIKHFMLAPGQETQCIGCSFEIDHAEGILTHLENHDVSYVAVARAPLDEIEQIKRRMGWRIRWVSSISSDFNYDFHVSFRPDEIASGQVYYNYEIRPIAMEDLSGNSVFYKNEHGEVFHTYSTFGRGPELTLGAYGILDFMPKGRNENGPYYSMADWVRPRDSYGKAGFVEPNGRYHPDSDEHAGCCSIKK